MYKGKINGPGAQLLIPVWVLGVMMLGAIGRADVRVAEGNQNIFIETVALNAQNEPMLQINVENPATDPDAEITALTITAASGTTGDDATDLAAGGVKLYWDKDGNGRLTTDGGAEPDVLLGAADFTANDGTAAFTDFSVIAPTGGEIDLLVLYDFAPGAVQGKSYRARLALDTDITVRHAATGVVLNASGAPVEGFLRTMGKGTLTLVRIAQDPDGAVAIPNRALLPLIDLEILANDVEDVEITALSFLDTGVIDALGGIVADSVRLFLGDVQPKTAGDAIAAVSFEADDAMATFAPNPPLRVARGQKIEIWVTVDVADAQSATIGDTLQIQVPAAAPFVAKGDFSLLEPEIIGSGTTGPQWQFNYNPILISAPNDIGEVLMPATSQGYPALGFQVRNDPEARSETVTISEFTIHADGTLDDVNAIDRVDLYHDLGKRGKVDEADELLGSGVFDADNGSLAFAFPEASISLGLGAKTDFVVGVNLSGTASEGQTLRLGLQSRDDMSIVGEISLVNGSLIPSPFFGPIKTIGQPRAELTLETSPGKIPPVVAPGATGFPILGLSIRNQQDENLLFKGVRLDFNGPLDETQFFDLFQIWFDSNGNGEQDEPDMQLGADGAVIAQGAEGRLELIIPDGEEYLIERGRRSRFTLFADVAATVLGDGSETFTVAGDSDAAIVLIGADSGAQAEFIGAIPPFAEDRTILNPAIEVTNFPDAHEVSGCINGFYGMAGVRFVVPSGEDLLIQRVRFSVTGSLNDPNFIAAATVWQDRNRDLFLNTSEANRDFGVHSSLNPVAVDNGEGFVDLSLEPGLVDRSVEFQLGVGLQFQALDPPTAQAQRGQTVTGHMSGDLIIEGVGARSGRPIEVSNAPGDDESRTITFDQGMLEVFEKPLERTAAPPNGNDIEVMWVQLKTGIIEPVRIDALTLTPLGTIDESIHIKPNGIKIYIDDNRNGKLDSRDFLFAAVSPPTVDNGTVTFTAGDYVTLSGNSIYSFPPSGKPNDHWLITVDLESSAPEGATVQFAIQGLNDLAATGACSLFPYQSPISLIYEDGRPPIFGPLIEVQRGAVEIVTDPGFAGDGDNIPEVVMAPLAAAYEVMRLDLRATPSEDVDLTGLTIRSTGAALEDADLAPFGVALYNGTVKDSNLIAGGEFSMDNGGVTFTGIDPPINLTDKTVSDLRVAFTGSGAGQLGGDFNMTIAGVDLEAIGLLSGLPITTITPVEPYAAIPVRLGAGRLTVRADQDHDFILPIPTGEDALIQRFRFLASRTEDIRLEEIKVVASGTADETTALENGALLMNLRSGNDPPLLIASAPFTPGDNGQADLRNLNIDIDAGKNTSTKYSLDAALNPMGTVVGTTLQVDLPSVLNVRAVGMLTGSDVEIVFDDFSGDEHITEAPSITGRTLTLTTGLVTLSKGNRNGENGTILGNEQKIPLLQVKVAVERDLEAVSISEVALCAAGTANETIAIGNVYLYQDVDQDGQATPADTLLGTAQFDADNGEARFSDLTLTYAEATDLRWLFAADLTGAGLSGETIQATLCAGGSITGTGQLTNEPINVIFSNSAPFFPFYTIDSGTQNAVRNWIWYD